MDTELKIAKAVLRNRIRERLIRISSAGRIQAARELCLRLSQQAVWVTAKWVLAFAPLPDEVDIWPLVETALGTGKSVAIPRFSSATRTYTAAIVRDLHTDLRRGEFGIREPCPACAELSLSRLDLVLVPGVAFDVHGHRLGRGKGYYDRLLADVRGVKCGVAFDQQVADEVPTGPQDVGVDYIVTPTRWLEC